MSQEEIPINTTEPFIDTPENREAFGSAELSDEEIDAAPIQVSPEHEGIQPDLPSGEWPRKLNKTDKERGDAERGKK